MGRGHGKLGPKKEKTTTGNTALERADQILDAIKLLVSFHSAREVRQAMQDKWGLSEASALRRIREAREAIRDDVNVADRQEIVATMAEQCLAVAKQATESRQLSNAIGAMRLYGELLNVCNK